MADHAAMSPAGASATSATFDALLACAPMGFAVLDRGFRYLHLNARFAELTGSPVDAHIGREARAVTPALAALLEPLMQRAIDTGEAIAGVEICGALVRTPNHQRRWEATIFPLRHSGARGGVTFGIGISLTEVSKQRELRAQAEEALRRHSLLFSTIGDGVLVMDLEGHITDMNPAAEQLFGYSRDELLGLPVVTVHHPSLEGKLEETIQASLRSEGRWSGELPFRRKDGSDGIADVVVMAQRDETGAPNAWIGVNRDITARRRLEEQLQQSQKMEAVGQLAGGVAHDFNNLLTVIKAYSGLVADQLDDGSPLKSDVVEIQRAAGRASSLTQQLLAFSRKQVLQPRVLDLNTVPRELEPMLRRLIGADVRIVLRPGASMGKVRADPGQIEQVLVNLAVNARDAMPGGGTLTIETANVELDEAYHARHAVVAPGAYVMLAVSDTGIGMDEVTRARIFEPFFTTKPAGKGTGLGLSTVYGIVKQSSGYIWVYSEPQLGTTFKVYLPRLDEAELGATTSERRDVALLAGSEIVLLVEDEPSVRSLARRILERQGYTVLEARDGNDALRVADQYRQPIQLLVTDMMMPELNGRDLWATLSTRRPELRVLFMSGYTNDDMKRRGYLHPGAAFLQKPFTAAELARAARVVLDNAGAGHS